MEAIDAARDLLPLAARYGNAVLYPLLSSAGISLVLLLTLRLTRPRVPAGAHWTERARANFIRLKLLFWAMVFSLSAAVFAAFDFTGPVGVIGELNMIGIVLVAHWIVASTVLRPLARSARPWLDARRRRRGRRGHFLLLKFPLLPVFLTMGALPVDPGPAFFVILTIGIAVLLYAMIGGGLRIALLLGLAKPAPETLRLVVTEVAADAGRSPPEVYLVEMDTANAIALPLLDTMCFSERAVEVLDEEELSRVAAHEMSHLVEPRRETAKRFLALPLLLCLMLVRPMVAHAAGHWLLLAFAVSLYLFVRARRVAHRLEQSADRDAQGETGDGGRALATALAKLYRENLTPAVMGGKSQTHPDLYDRLIAAGITPEYPRPAPPRTPRLGIALTALAGCILFVLLLVVASTARASARSSATAALAAIAVTGGDAQVLEDLAGHWSDAGRVEEAGILYDASFVLESEGD